MGIKLDQKEPGTWLGVGLLIVIAGAILNAAEPDGGQAGKFLAAVGGVVLLIGLIAFAVRIGTSGSRDS